MGKNCFLYILVMFVLNSTLISCTKEIDFNQVNDIEISPILETSLIFFDATAPDFFIGGSELSVVQDFVLIDVFNSTFINDNLIKTEFVLETINSINRGYSLRIDFLDNSNQLQHSFTTTAPASPSNSDVFSSHTEVFEGASLVALKQTSQLVFTLIMLPGPPINDATLGRIHLESKNVFYFNYKG